VISVQYCWRKASGGGRSERETNDTRPHTRLKSVHGTILAAAAIARPDATPSTPYEQFRQWCQADTPKTIIHLYVTHTHAPSHTDILYYICVHNIHKYNIYLYILYTYTSIYYYIYGEIDFGYTVVCVCGRAKSTKKIKINGKKEYPRPNVNTCTRSKYARKVYYYYTILCYKMYIINNFFSPSHSPTIRYYTTGQLLCSSHNAYLFSRARSNTYDVATELLYVKIIFFQGKFGFFF